MDSRLTFRVIFVTIMAMTISFAGAAQTQKPKPYCTKNGKDCDFLAVETEGIYAKCEAIQIGQSQDYKYICIKAFLKDKKSSSSTTQYDAKPVVPENTDGTPCEARDTEASGKAKEVCNAALKKRNGHYKIDNRFFDVSSAGLPSTSYLCKGKAGKKLIVCPLKATEGTDPDA